MEFLAEFFQTTDTRLIIIASMTLVFAFYMAWTIGANDVANSMATSVGSGTINFRQAVIIAGIANFLGATLAGGSVTDTVRKGIVNSELFVQDPNLLIIGMVAALLASAVWLHSATFLGLPVSTTHSIVGAIVGFGLIVYGLPAVHWGKVVQIILSWVISPVGGGLLAYFLFIGIRRFILNAAVPHKRMLLLGPFLGAMTIGIIVLSAIWKGLKNLDIILSPLQLVLVSLLAAVAGYFFLLFFIRRNQKDTRDPSDLSNIERTFMMLQIVTATYVAFSHGSNDVANAIGPMAAVLATIKDGIVALKVPVPLWVLMLGGTGIAVGLAMYGWKVMKTVGHKITEITPSRGFSAEFAAATVVTVASKMGLPISTTHTLVGAVLG
ncbi:phosphate permease, partial [bacterium]|nr:phosphate permease [bacterium]